MLRITIGTLYTGLDVDYDELFSCPIRLKVPAGGQTSQGLGPSSQLLVESSMTDCIFIEHKPSSMSIVFADFYHTMHDGLLLS